ncbi:MAG: hypothetical protein LBP59_01425 [Planctomycetaceae bacterium]|jgi:hypothetical protein|nr:hypothetical protein [Planctomycetaceae bacterium]
MIILYPGYSLQSLVTELSETESTEIISAFTALFHPAIFKHFGKIPQLESASNLSSDFSAELILTPPCCETYLTPEIIKTAQENNVTIIRNLKSRNAIVNEIIKRRNIKHNFHKEFIDNFYAVGTSVLFVNLLSHHLHYMDNTNDAATIQALHNIIDHFADNNKNENHNNNTGDNSATIIVTKNQTADSVMQDLFREAFERICENKECYYPVSSYLLDLTLVVKSTLGDAFRRLLEERGAINFLLPSALLDALPEIDPESFKALQTAVKFGKADFAVDDVSLFPLLLQPLLDVADKILQSITIYRERLGVTPKIYGRQHVGLAPFLPQILRLAGYEGVLFFAPLDGWHLKQRNQSKMIWRGTDGAKIDALIRYPKNCATNKEFFDFADYYSELINSDSVPTAVFAAFSVDKIKQIKKETDAKPSQNNIRNDNSADDNFCNDNSDAANTDDVKSDEPDWFNDLRKLSNYTTQLGEYAKLESYFATTAQTGSEEFIAIENFFAGEPSDIPFWVKLYRENLMRTVSSAFNTVAKLLNPKLTGKSDFESVADLISTLGLHKITDNINKNNFDKNNFDKDKDKVGENIVAETAQLSQERRCGIVIFNSWNFCRRAFVDVSDWFELPAAVAPVFYAGEASGKKELIIDVPPLGYVFIPAPKGTPKNDQISLDNIEQKNQNSTKPESQQNSGWNPFAKLFAKKPKPELIFKPENQKAFLLQNEYFVAKIDFDTGMLRSLFTGNYRYNRLSQQLGFRLPKALREVDSRLANDPNRGYASSVVEAIEIAELGDVTGSVRIRGRLVCDDGCDAAFFTELITIRRYSRILEFNFAIEPLLQPSGDSAWDSYYAIRSAWNDSSLEIRGCLGDGIYPITTNRVLSPRFIDLRAERRAITFFTEGLPFHRRFGERYLDTILIAKGDDKYDKEGNKIDNNNDNNNCNNNGGNNISATKNNGGNVRNFRFGVGIDIRHPPASSLEFMLAKEELVAPVYNYNNSNKINNNSEINNAGINNGGINIGGVSSGVVSRWFFRLDAPNIITMHWETIYDCDLNTNTNTNTNADITTGIIANKNVDKNADKNKGEPVGFKVFLLETEGVQTNSVLRSFKPVVQSYTTNLLGENLQQLNINEAGIQITMHPHELLPIICLFRNKN